ncbi:MAG: CAP domain-containing protein [Cyanobacteria bacterium J06597_16]
MKWTTWWSIAIVGIVATGCGGGGGGPSADTLSDDSNTQVQQTSASASSNQCAPLGSFFSELLTLTNQARQAAGVGNLRFSYQLGQSAQGYAEDLATQNFFSHTGKDNSTLKDRISAVGYKYARAGENLAAGQSSAQTAFQDWMNSEGHRKNILQPDFMEVGFGLFDTTGSSDYGRYWVQHFGKPQDNQQSDQRDERIYIPQTCGTAIAGDSSALNQAVAGISIGQAAAIGADARSLPGESHIGTSTQAAAGALPAGNLAAALGNRVAQQSESVPEPSALIGLATLGVIAWRSRKGGHNTD